MEGSANFIVSSRDMEIVLIVTWNDAASIWPSRRARHQAYNPREAIQNEGNQIVVAREHGRP